MMSSRMLSPIGDGIFAKIVMPSQGRTRQPLPRRRPLTIDQQIQRILENQILQQPGSYAFINLDEHVIYIR